MIHNISVNVYYQGILINVDIDKLDHSLCLFEFLVQLEKQLVSVVSRNLQDNIWINLDLIKDCENLVRDHNVNLQINAQMTEIMITQNNHYLLVERKEKNFLVKQHSLPDIQRNDICKEFKEEVSLQALFRIFKHNLQLLERFYADLEEIDLVCYIIDPIKPSTKNTHRQISLGKYIFIRYLLSIIKYTLSNTTMEQD